MSDRAPAQVIFYGMPSAEVPAIVEWLNEYGMTPHYMGEAPTDRIELGVAYGASDVNVSVMLDGVRELQEIASRSTWKLSQDSIYDIDGEHATYTPELGLWSGLCTQGGEPVFTRGDILTAIEFGEKSGPEMSAALDRLTGGPWIRVIETFEQALSGDEASERRCRACGTPSAECDARYEATEMTTGELCCRACEVGDTAELHDPNGGPWVDAEKTQR